MSSLLVFARQPVVRFGFLVGALGLAAWAVARDWDAVGAAFDRMDGWLLAVAVVASLAYVGASMQSWREVMADLGSPLGARDSAQVFLVSQMGKYVPGGVWNVVAGAELARDRGVSRARAAGALAMTMIVSALVGVALVGAGAAFAPHALPGWVRILGLGTPVALWLLTPAALSRFLALALRVVRRPDAAPPFTTRGVLKAAVWALAAWVLAGLQVWALGVGLGLHAGVSTLIIATTGFAAAWLVGFAILVLPAGLGARELVLFPVLAPHLNQATILALVLASRVLFTAADGAGALAAVLVGRLRGRRAPSR